MEEDWKEIEGYGNIYSISNFGRVMSKARTQTYSDGRVYRHTDKILKPSTSTSGYSIIHFYFEGDRTTLQLHRLVSEAFIPNIENKPCVNHKDGDKKNNHISNLEWNTYSENNVHAVETGLRQNPDNSYRSKLSKLTEEQYQYIADNCKLGVPGHTASEIAKLFGVSDQTVLDAYHRGVK